MNKSVSFDAVVERLEEMVDETASIEKEPVRQQSRLCPCLRQYTSVLCQLQTIEMRQHPVKTDTLLTSANLVMSQTEDQLKCTQCMYDSRVLVQLVMVIQTMFNWVQGQCQTPLAPSSHIKATLGQHNLTREESTFIKMALISRALARIRTVLKVMVSRVEQMSLGRQWERSEDPAEAEVKNLQSLIDTLLQTSSRLLRWFASRG